MKTIKAAAALVGVSILSVGGAQALVAPLDSAGSTATASGGGLSATFLGSDAGLTNSLFLVTNDGIDGNDILLFEKSTASGTTVNLGTFAAGSELVFRLFVNETAQSFFSGLASSNLDNFAHARVDVTTFPGQWLIGFEDLLGGGDRDFNDFLFTLNPTVSTDLSTPIPGAAVLLLSGLAGAAGVGRLRKKRV